MDVLYWFKFRPIFNRFDFFIFHSDILGQNDVSQKIYRIFMEMAFL